MNLLIDVQGTLISDIDRKPIDGAIEFIEKLNNEKIPYVFITNNTKHKSFEFLGYLNDIGFEVGIEKYLDPLMVLEDIIPIVSKSEVEIFGSFEFREAILELGYKESLTPKSFFVGVNQNYTNEDYSKMIELALLGVVPVAMHATSTYAKDGKRYPGVGAIFEMIKYASGKDYLVAGKPSKYFYERALLKLQAQNKIATFANLAIISDDARGDLVGAKRLGAKTVLVLSGKAKTKEEALGSITDEDLPDLVLDGISDINNLKGFWEKI